MSPSPDQQKIETNPTGMNETAGQELAEPISRRQGGVIFGQAGASQFRRRWSEPKTDLYQGRVTCLRR
jgi:hypothetical protein